jgi:hypothetical protein
VLADRGEFDHLMDAETLTAYRDRPRHDWTTTGCSPQPVAGGTTATQPIPQRARRLNQPRSTLLRDRPGLHPGRHVWRRDPLLLARGTMGLISEQLFYVRDTRTTRRRRSLISPVGDP